MGLVMLNYDGPFANDWDQRHNIRSVSDHDSLLYVLLIGHKHINVFFSEKILSALRHFQHTNHAG